jgi:hypothetical protein
MGCDIACKSIVCVEHALFVLVKDFYHEGHFRVFWSVLALGVRSKCSKRGDVKARGVTMINFGIEAFRKIRERNAKVLGSVHPAFLPMG